MSNSFILRILATLLLGISVIAAFASSGQFGYVDCPRKVSSGTLVFFHPCVKQATTVIHCGQKLRVLGRENVWLKIALRTGGVGYVGAASVSKEPDSFIPLDSFSPIKPSIDLAHCSSIRAARSPNQDAELLVSAIDVSDKDTELEADGPIDRMAVLVGFVGTDGRAHDLQIQLPVGNGLDEKVEAIVENSRFAPALKNGRPVSSLVYFDVAISYTCIGGTARSTFCKPFLFIESLRKPD